jgi:hypothetical protein
MCLEQGTVGSRQKADKVLMNTEGGMLLRMHLFRSQGIIAIEKGDIFPRALFWT